MPLTNQAFRETLLEKGWTEDEITKAYGMLYKPVDDKKNMTYVQESSIILYEMMLLAMVVFTMIASFGLIPFLLLIKLGNAYLFPLAVVIGLVLGYFLNILVLDLEFIGVEHHYTVLFFIPIMAVINLIFISPITGTLAEKMKIANPEFTLIVSVVYTLAMCAPNGISLALRPFKKRKAEQEKEMREKEERSMHVYRGGGQPPQQQMGY